jgi:hypothetical protein
LPKIKVTKQKGSTNRDFFTPDKIIALASGLRTSQKSPRYCCTISRTFATLKIF